VFEKEIWGVSWGKRNFFGRAGEGRGGFVYGPMYRVDPAMNVNV
jgi:hypothetical protein